MNESFHTYECVTDPLPTPIAHATTKILTVFESQGYPLEILKKSALHLFDLANSVAS